ncbi:2-dehydro-3-deoxygluconokinase [Mesorhizobium sp. SARCC-RB16n]|uniref:sugar kinase n=1 Tax=Mesorhizobium sp. SARCC-RB16n TaxID=2116687 RepID=UPI00122F40E4|nr:sugar kinase [Mesorhizobium sp. SARCC-RB16n]KAA3449389.1 2-dehydro-3-deoxygluconokinase [Mesorhizobium sp. SARCC-RB16n]
MVGNGVASIGECMLELSGQTGPNWRMGFAGDTFNTLWALHALSGDRPATYVSAFGDDPFSQGQIAFFAENGIGIGSSPVIHGARPGLYAITLTGAERSFTYWRGDAAARQLASDPAALSKNLENQALVYFSGITLAILDDAARTALLAAVAKARAAGSLIAFDPNYRPRLWRRREDAQAAIFEALAVTDIALPTFPDEQMLFGDDTPQSTADRLGQLVNEVVVKNGEAPALIAEGGALGEVAAIHVAMPVDTTGAGDSFNGGYLAARLAGFGPADAVQHAHRVAAAVVQVRGALAPFETLQAAFGKVLKS